MANFGYLIYDCEIIRCIPPRSGERDPNYEFCEGWRDFESMGIACIGWAHSNGSEGVIVPDSPSMIELAIDVLYRRCDKLVGFNSRMFDDHLLLENGVHLGDMDGEWMSIDTHYDLLELVRLAAYGSTDYRDCPKGHSYKLGLIGEANGFPKTGTGELAPQMWQDGRRAECIAYCLNDARITRELFELALRGELIDPNTGEKLDIRPHMEG